MQTCETYKIKCPGAVSGSVSFTCIKRLEYCEKWRKKLDEKEDTDLKGRAIKCKHTGKPLLYRTDGYGFFVACEDYPECPCCISIGLT